MNLLDLEGNQVKAVFCLHHGAIKTAELQNTVGLLGCWSVGLLECWAVGVLGCWAVGVLRC